MLALAAIERQAAGASGGGTTSTTASGGATTSTTASGGATPTPTATTTEVVIELVLFFAVEEKVIWDMVKDFEAAIAEAGRVDGKSFAGGGAMRILSTKHAENIAYV